MARAFKNTPRGLTGQLERAERDLLRNLFDDVITLLEPEELSPEDLGRAGGRSKGATGKAEAGAPAAASSSATDPLWELTGLRPEDFAAPHPDDHEPEAPAPPRDPALARLLPDAVRDDAAASAAFRGLTERALREAKIASLRAAKLCLETSRIHLDDAAAPRFAAALNDVRLVLAERLGIADEADAERIHAVESWAEAETVDDYLALVYNFVTWVQDSLMLALTDRLERGLEETD